MFECNNVASFTLLIKVSDSSSPSDLRSVLQYSGCSVRPQPAGGSDTPQSLRASV